MDLQKITIIGAGRVGSTVAQLCAYRELADVVLIDQPAELAKGVALDLMHAMPIENSDARVVGTGDYAEIEGSEIICITAGGKRLPGMNREDLLLQNARIVKSVSQKIAKHCPESKLIVVTNPLDAMTYVAKKTTGFPRERVVGMAGVLDSARFRALVAIELGVGTQEVSAMVVGGHGDEMVPLIGRALVQGVPLRKRMTETQIQKTIERTRNAGEDILALQKNASAYYAPASAIVQMIEAMLHDRKTMVPCSVYLEGEYGVRDMCIGVPVVLGKSGVEKIVRLELNTDEKTGFEQSVDAIRKLVERVQRGI